MKIAILILLVLTGYGLQELQIIHLQSELSNLRASYTQTTRMTTASIDHHTNAINNLSAALKSNAESVGVISQYLSNRRP